MKATRLLLIAVLINTFLASEAFTQSSLWSDFTYNSPEEKAFWDKLPDWSDKFRIKDGSSIRRNLRGEVIDKDSLEGFTGIVKSKKWGVRTLLKYADGYLIYREEWHKSGIKSAEISIKNGLADGLRLVWDEKGQMRTEQIWRDGQLMSAEVWKPNGEKCPVTNLKNRNGVIVRYNEDGTERDRTTYKDGKYISYTELSPPPPPPLSKPPPLIKKITEKSVSDKNSSKPQLRTLLKDGKTIPPTPTSLKIPIKSLPLPPPEPPLDWSDFTYSSAEEKAFWDKLPDWIVAPKWPKGLENPFFPGWKRNALGKSIDHNSTEGFTGYVKNKTSNSRTIYQFVDGRLLRSKSWQKAGLKKYEIKYNLSGRFYTHWYENGQKKSEIQWRGKLLIGNQILSAEVWKPNGEKCPETNFKDGTGVVISYHENGQKWKETNYKDGRKDGLSKEWYKSGQKKSEENYKDGREDGLSTFWHENGQKKDEGNYKKGFRNGLWTEWDENGVKKETHHGIPRPTPRIPLIPPKK